jgi:uncharacterized protein DUF1844
MADEKDVGFKITDRRKFNPDGTPRSEGVDEPTTAPATAAEPSEANARVLEFPGETGKKKEKAGGAERPPTAAAQSADWSAGLPPQHGMPEPSFENLINMLAVEAVMHLGLIENPAGGHSVDLAAARHMIDMLGMLEVKTRGNLDNSEAELMEGVLADLRMQFVAVSRAR